MAGTAAAVIIIPAPVSRQLVAWPDEVVVIGEDDGRGPVAQVKLGEQMIDVRLYRAFADEEPLRDLAVGAALGDEGEHLALPLGELAQRWRGCSGRGRVPVDGENPAGDGGVEPRATSGDGAPRAVQFLG